MMTYLAICICCGLGAIALGRAALKFDRRMVDAGNQRRRDVQAMANATRDTGPLARLVLLPAADGTVQYAVQLDGEPTLYPLARDTALPVPPAAISA